MALIGARRTAAARARLGGAQSIRRSRCCVSCRPLAGTDVRELVRACARVGRAWVAATTFEGRDVVRICATHGASTLADVDALVRALSAAGAERP